MLLPLPRFESDSDSWLIWRGLGLGAKGLISIRLHVPHCSVTSASGAGCLSSWSFVGEIELSVKFLFSHETLQGTELGEGEGEDKSPNLWNATLTTVQIVWADYETSQIVSPETTDDLATSIPTSHPRPADERWSFLSIEAEDLVGKLRQ